jgi:prevent-host-death family protein
MADREPMEISASEVRGQISEVISRVAFGGERLVISRNGNVRVAIVPITDLDRLKDLDRQQATKAVADLRASSANRGVAQLSDEEIAAEIKETRRTRGRSRR